jgi:hypothetical protein
MKYASVIAGAIPSILIVSVLVFPSGITADPQRGVPLPDQRQTQPDADNVWQEQQRKEMEKKANLERQQDIKKDTEKLLELATELKQSVDKSNENTLSLDVIKKAEQIEKLAKAVKEKMKGP